MALFSKQKTKGLLLNDLHDFVLLEKCNVPQRQRNAYKRPYDTDIYMGIDT